MGLFRVWAVNGFLLPKVHPRLDTKTVDTQPAKGMTITKPGIRFKGACPRCKCEFEAMVKEIVLRACRGDISMDASPIPLNSYGLAEPREYFTTCPECGEYDIPVTPTQDPSREGSGDPK